jgi:tetratricopeptide (TPR) repeat protein
MLSFAWLALRQAQEALKTGRLEEAQRLLCQPAAHGHKRSWELLQQVAQGFVERGKQHLRHDHVAAAWNDLVAAEQMGIADDAAFRLRQELSQHGLTEVRTLLEAGEAGRALEVIGQLRNRSVQQPELPLLEEAAKSWTLAKEQAGRGEFAQALQSAGRVRKLLPCRADALEQFLISLEQQLQSFSALLVQLHEAAEQRHWQDVVRLSEQVLAIAPQHLEARKARARAWRVLEPQTVASAPREVEPADTPPPRPAPEQRFLLWIDGVGGYLVCLGNRVTLGQATPDAYVDIPLYADVSRIHAALTRDTEGYVLEATRPLQVNSQAVERTLLQAGDRITLGAGCQLQFRQPVPVSATARLDLVSGHRLPLAVDGVLLMADTLVLGPGSQVHVSMPDLREPIILYRHVGGLGVRHTGKVTIDGQRCGERGLLRPNSMVSGDDFAFTIEPVGTELGRR